MARYTQRFVVAAPAATLQQHIAEALQACELPVVYSTDDYVLAQEATGRVAFSKLVTVEVLIHQPDDRADRVELTCVTKNDELPLKRANHCRTIADLVAGAFKSRTAWQVLDSSDGFF
ncbi:MAG: hypothetical protein HC918_05085 [Oscillatoriales cyanobacterium SM2_1_8]|nr:hypothetical protein [Oscillatoriales cyanobacterium SM2_1_8]